MSEKKTANLLELTPVRLNEFVTERSELITIIEPRFRKAFWKKIFPARLTEKNIRVKLDEIGSSVWLQIDGERNVQDICHILSKNFGEKISPAEERVTKFISQLFDNRFITFKEIV